METATIFLLFGIGLVVIAIAAMLLAAFAKGPIEMYDDERQAYTAARWREVRHGIIIWYLFLALTALAGGAGVLAINAWLSFTLMIVIPYVASLFYLWGRVSESAEYRKKLNPERYVPVPTLRRRIAQADREDRRTPKEKKVYRIFDKIRNESRRQTQTDARHSAIRAESGMFSSSSLR